MEAVKQRAEYRQKRAEFQKKAETLRAALLKDPSISGKVASVKGAEDFLHRPEKPYIKKEAELEKQAAPDILSSQLENSVNTLSNITAIKSRKDENEALRDEQRGAILADLLSSDPIPQDADPRQVAAVYKSIVSSSPRVSLNKEVVRSVLRGAVNSIAFSPNDMKVLTDVDKGINQAYNLSNLDSSVKDSNS